MPTEPKVHIGTCVERLPKHEAQDNPSFVELRARGTSLPRPASLARWRADHPEMLVAVALPAQDSLQLPGDLLSWAKKATDAVGACALVVPSSARVTPTDRNRAHLSALPEHIPLPAGCLLVWAPAGVWEVDEAEAVAREAGIVATRDPLQHPSLTTGVPGYLRVQAHGVQSRLSEGALSIVAEQLVRTEAEVYVVVDSSRGAKDAQRLNALLQLEQTPAL